MERDELTQDDASFEHEKYNLENSKEEKLCIEEYDLRGSFPAMAALAEWPQLEREDPLVWPDMWKRPDIPEPLRQYFDLQDDMYLCENRTSSQSEEESMREYEGRTVSPDFGIAFQMVDITYSMHDIIEERTIKMAHVDDPNEEDIKKYPPSYYARDVVVRQEPEIRMFGTNAAGNSVCFRYRGFLPYFFIQLHTETEEVLAKKYEQSVEEQVRVRLEVYMSLTKKEKETLRVAGMHVEPIQWLVKRVSQEMNLLAQKVGQYPSNSVTDALMHALTNHAKVIEDFRQNELSLSAMGDRAQVTCPHWTRIKAVYPTLLDSVFKVQPEAKLRARERRSRVARVKKKEAEDPIYSFLVHCDSFSGEKTATKDFVTPGGVTVPKVSCSMCRETFEICELLLQTCWDLTQNTHTMTQACIERYFEDMEECINDICKRLIDDVVQPVCDFEKEATGRIEHPGRFEDFERQHVSSVRFENEHQIMGGCKAKDSTFLRLELFSPRHCSEIRTAVQYGGILNHVPIDNKTHADWIRTCESNIPFTLRFMVDHDICGMGWVYSSPRAWVPVPVWDADRKSKCQIEVFIDGWTNELPSDQVLCGKDWEEMAPLIWIFFDDEMAGQNPNQMPSASNIGDLLTQSGVLMYRQSEKDPFEACIFSLGGSEPLLRRVNRNEEISDAERALFSRAKILTFGSECDLLLAWRRMIEIVCPDFLCGYNSVDFDLPYMVRRSTAGVAVGQDTHMGFRRLSKIIERETERADGSGTYWRGLTDIRKERFQSKAFGLRENDKANTVGISQFDVLRVIKQHEKKRSYKLDNVSREELNMHKVPLPYTEITPKAISPYDVMRALLNRYCLWDSILPKLVSTDTKTYDIIYTEMARITGVTMDQLLGKGQRVKITNRLLKTARRARLDIDGIYQKICPSPGVSPFSTTHPISFLIPYDRACPMDVNPMTNDTQELIEGEDDDDDHMTRGAGYSGATVLKAKRGYYEEPTPTLDFSSLYPSIMMALNICITTYLGTREDAEAMGLKCSWDMRKEKDFRFDPMSEIPDGDFIVTPNNAAFISRKHRVGLMCVDLQELLGKRSHRKKMMGKFDKGTKERAAHNGAQLGLKVTANSMYGYTAGCNTAVSEAVTSSGRFLLEYTRDLVYEKGQSESRYANEQLYGDSVTGDTPLLIKDVHTGLVSWTRIDSLVKEHEYSDRENSEKEQVIFRAPRYQVWTDSGWTHVKKTIRHRAGKDIYRVLTHTGVVDVTEDHSLLDHEGNEISPKDISVGTRLLHNSPRAALQEEDFIVPLFSEEEAYAMGAFLSSGSCGAYEHKPEKKFKRYTWAISKKDRGFLERCAECLPFDTKILDVLESSHVYKLIPYGKGKKGVTRDIVKRYRSLFYNEQGQKSVPTEILMAPKVYAQSFFNGFYAGDVRKVKKCTSFGQNGKEVTAGMMFLSQRLGWKASINTQIYNSDLFTVTLTKGKQRAAIDKVKKILLLRKSSTDEYVYDLETENHHFHVGPGDMVVHNTDSIMFRLLNVTKVGEGRYDLLEAAQIGVELAKWVTVIFQKFGFFCITLAFEKVYETWLLKSKKCYAVYKHLFDVKTGKLTAYLSSSGMESVRRDVTLFTKDVLERVIKMTVQDRDLNGAIRFTQKMFTELKEGRVPIEKLTITGGFTKRADQYKNPQPHIEAVRKQMDDDPNNAPTVGSRIDWVIASLSEDPSVNFKAKVYEQAVMPGYLEKHGLKLDYEKYLKKCGKPFCRFFAPALAPKMSATEGQTYVMRRIFDDYFREQDKMKKRRKSALVESFARGNHNNKRKPGSGGALSASEHNAEMNKIDPSRAKYDKKRKTDPGQIRNDRKGFSLDALVSTEDTFDEWLFSAGTNKKGAHFKNVVKEK